MTRDSLIRRRYGLLSRHRTRVFCQSMWWLVFFSCSAREERTSLVFSFFVRSVVCCSICRSVFVLVVSLTSSFFLFRILEDRLSVGACWFASVVVVVRPVLGCCCVYRSTWQCRRHFHRCSRVDLGSYSVLRVLLVVVHIVWSFFQRKYHHNLCT